MASVKIQQQKNGQFMITIPQNIAAAYDIKKHQTATWKVGGAKKLELQL